MKTLFAIAIVAGLALATGAQAGRFGGGMRRMAPMRSGRLMAEPRGPHRPSVYSFYVDSAAPRR